MKTLQLGTDLRSDICGMTADEAKIYASIRNSITIKDDFVYTAGQDKKLSKIDLRNYECAVQKRNAHKKMFDCAGIYKKNVITISYPCSEISIWDSETLDLVKVSYMPLALAGRTLIEHDLLYISSRNINGIAVIHLNDLLADNC